MKTQKIGIISSLANVRRMQKKTCRIRKQIYSNKPRDQRSNPTLTRGRGRGGDGEGSCEEGNHGAMRRRRSERSGTSEVQTRNAGWCNGRRDDIYVHIYNQYMFFISGSNLMYQELPLQAINV